jgi:hypothetical protein
LGLWVIFGIAHEHTEPPYTVSLLGLNHNRPNSGKCSNRIDEIAPSHCLSQGVDHANSGADYRRDLPPVEWGFTLRVHIKNLKSCMSALSHKQTLRCVRAMSALPSEADIG